MALVKIEDIEDSNRDTWLSYWTNPEKEVKKETISSCLDTKFGILEENVVKRPKLEESKKAEALKANSQINRKLGSLKCKEKNNNEVQGSSNLNVDGTNVKMDKKKSKRATKSHKATKPWKEAIEKANISDRIANMCEFQCPSCSVILTSQHSVSRHFKKTEQ